MFKWRRVIVVVILCKSVFKKRVYIGNSTIGLNNISGGEKVPFISRLSTKLAKLRNNSNKKLQDKR